MSSADVTPPYVGSTLGDLQKRIGILEALVPATGGGSYLQPSVHSVYGLEWEVMTAKGNFQGGNTGGDPVSGDWSYNVDLTAPWGGYISTTTDQDYFQFAMPNLGPQGSSYAVAVWYYGGPDAPQLEIEWATGPIDEITATSGSVGSATSIVGPSSVAFFGATDFAWFNTNNNIDIARSWKWDAYAASGGWDLVIQRSPFVLAGVDGTPLTADGTINPDFGWSYDFNGGGGPDIAWWVRILVNGKNGSSSGYHARVAGIRVYRINGAADTMT